MIGTLYIISTPIGNLEDLTYRAHRILQEVHIIAAEDTRHTQKLCGHYGISTTLTSYHDFNKAEKTSVLLEKLREGHSIALVSDAGTPLISDPGYYLLTRAIREHIPVVPIPGPSAILTALAASGLPTDAFRYEGFLPRKSTARIRVLEALAVESRTIILFETPHRIKATLSEIQEIFGNRKLAIARELTKIYEEIIRGSAKEILERYNSQKPRGEITLVIAGRPRSQKQPKRNMAATLPPSESIPCDSFPRFPDLE
jgi:16S rRNA (cytidine1402-2'-O)-methyltransferase